ncbi:MAG: STAS domain-containing protein [Moorellales bacterium]
MERLVLTGRVGREHASELKDALLAMARRGPVLVDLSGLECLDLALLQLLLAARRELPVTIVPPQREEERALLGFLGVI